MEDDINERPDHHDEVEEADAKLKAAEWARLMKEADKSSEEEDAMISCAKNASGGSELRAAGLVGSCEERRSEG